VGSAVTAVLMIVALQLAGLLLSANRFETALQAAGSVALFLVSFFFFGTIFIFGAVFIRVYATIFGSRIVTRQETVVTDETDAQVKHQP
jgi:uncharacterized BrkB/YihY/UPF0761 family membrane protein